MSANRTYANSKRKVAKKYKTTVKKATIVASTVQSMIKHTLYKNLAVRVDYNS